MNFYDNYKRLNTNYNKQFIETIAPKDYSKEIRVKSPDLFYQVQRDYSNNLQKSNFSQDLSQKEQILLQTGTEHWETTYKSSIVDPYSYAKSSKPLWSLHKPPYTVDRQNLFKKSFNFKSIKAKSDRQNMGKY